MKKTFFRRSKRLLIIALLLATLSFSMVGETGAWLKHTSSADSTTMTKSTYGLEFSGSTLTALKVKNTSNVPMYVRVAFAVNYVNTESGNWYNSDGTYSQTRQYLADAPKNASYTNDDNTTASADYTYTLNTGWAEKNISETVNGVTVTYKIIYLTSPLAAGATSTNAIFKSFTANKKTKTYYMAGKNRTYTMTVDLVADAIQAENSGRFSGTTNTAVYKAWGVTPASVGGDLSKYPTADSMPNP